MEMSEPIRHLFGYSIEDILSAMPSPDDPSWDFFALRQNKEHVHRATRTMAFAWSERWDGIGVPVVLWPDYAPAPLRAAVADCAEAIRAHFGGLVTRVILAELPPGTEIAAHVDGGPLLTMVHRCHVPILTNPGVVFAIDGVDQKMRAGQVYELDNMRRHGVANHGTERRIHLICNVLPSAIKRSA